MVFHFNPLKFLSAIYIELLFRRYGKILKEKKVLLKVFLPALFMENYYFIERRKFY